MRSTALSACLLLAAIHPLSGQCPDGTPLANCATVRATRTAAPAPAVRPRHIALLPFRNVTRTAANDWLVSGAPLLLGEILGQYQDLSVVSEPQLTGARRRLGIATDVVPDETQQ